MEDKITFYLPILIDEYAHTCSHLRLIFNNNLNKHVN
jgi:hypothetical protein